MTRDRSGPRQSLVVVQMLRGLAATLVLIGHVQGAVLAAAAPLGTRPWVVQGFPGGFGVDLFFSISGFIILTSSGDDAGRPGGRRRFLRKRIIRLVPMYWLFTLLFLPLLLAGRTAPRGDLGSALLASFLFVPHRAVVGPDGAFPIYDLGWTLNFEMFFYAIFALFLSRPLRTTAAGSASVLLLLVIAGLALPHGAGAVLSVWTAPILVEFVLGLAIGVAFLSPLRLPASVSVALVALAVAWVLLDPARLGMKPPGAVTPNDLRRVLGWGVPAAAILAAAVFHEKRRPIAAARVTASLRRLGDASYSLYLVHPIVIVVLLKIWDEAVPVPVRCALTVWPVLGFGLFAAAIVSGLAVHHAVERRLMLAMRRPAFPGALFLRDAFVMPAWSRRPGR